MAIIVNEASTGRKVDTGPNKYSLEMVYKIQGVLASDGFTQIDAYNKLIDETDESLLMGLVTRTGATATEIDGGSGQYEGVVRYEFTNDQPKQTGETSFNFDTAGGTIHIVSNIATSNKYPSGAPDPQGLINAKEDSVDGLDVSAPLFSFTATRYMTISDVSSTYVGHLYNLTNKVNSADITMTVDGLSLSFAHGELLFLGATGSRRGQGDVEVSLKFSAAPNKTGITIGSITGIAKKGWEYIDVVSKPSTQNFGAIKVIRQIPQFVYVHQIYEEGDMSQLGIPT